MTHNKKILSMPQLDMLRWLNTENKPVRLSRHDHIATARALVNKGFLVVDFQQYEADRMKVKTYAITDEGRKELADHRANVD